MRMIAKLVSLTLAGVLAFGVAARAEDPLADAAAVGPWARRLDVPRRVVDRVVVCFDAASVLREISAWDRERFWPVLLWDSNLVPKFIAAFQPEQVLLAEYARDGGASLAAGLDAVARSWGLDPVQVACRPEGFLAALGERERAPLGVVLLAEGSPELLGGVALAAGRMHLPLPFPAPETHEQRVNAERMGEIRRQLAEVLGDLGIAFTNRFDDLDFVTVASDLAFGYTLSDPGAHPGGYTVDDALARNEDLSRWGWVGRLAGGPEHSVYMAMGALFLEPESGLFFSRYATGNSAFGAFDPAPALPAFQELFPTAAISHPDATLARWREVQWPAGNRAGFLFVNSSGGATSWSTSKGGATHFDVPDTVPAVVHYTHSGSAGRPFDVDTIAGRWLENGAYVYFGSYAEPYLGAFIPPAVLAARVKAGAPLGAAMRHLYSTSPAVAGQTTVKVGGEDQVVPINMSGPWKLAYFGDPSYRLTAGRSPREAAEVPARGYYASVRKFAAERRRTADEKVRHLLASIGVVRLDPAAKSLVDERAWSRIRKAVPASAAPAALAEMVRVWVASLSALPAEQLYDARRIRALARVPAAIAGLAKDGADAEDAQRHFSEFAKAYVAGIALHPDMAVGKDPELARWVLEIACGLAPSKGSSKPFYAWVKAAAAAFRIDLKDLRESIAKLDWASRDARDVAAAELN